MDDSIVLGKSFLCSMAFTAGVGMKVSQYPKRPNEEEGDIDVSTSTTMSSPLKESKTLEKCLSLILTR